MHETFEDEGAHDRSQCCQCSCPVLRDGTRMHGPQLRPGEEHPEFWERVNSHLSRVPIGTSTRCEHHNAPPARRARV